MLQFASETVSWEVIRIFKLLFDFNDLHLLDVLRHLLGEPVLAHGLA